MAALNDVSLGHRVFVVDCDSVVRVPQKTFDDFYFRELPTLGQFAAKTVVVAVAIYTLEARKPKHVVRIDTMQVRVAADGSIDKSHKEEALRLAVDGIDLGGDPDQPSPGPNVVDAKRRFDKRRRDRHQPKLAGPVHKKILEALFK